MGLNADKYILERIIGLKCVYISSLSCLTVSFLNASFEVVGKHPFVSVREDPDLLSEIWVQPYSLFGKIMQITDSAAAFSFNQMQRFCIFLFAVCYHCSPPHQSLQYYYWVTSQWPHSTFTHTNSYWVRWSFSFSGSCGICCATAVISGASCCEQLCPTAHGVARAELSRAVGRACLASTYQLIHQRARYVQLCVCHH